MTIGKETSTNTSQLAGGKAAQFCHNTSGGQTARSSMGPPVMRGPIADVSSAAEVHRRRTAYSLAYIAPPPDHQLFECCMPKTNMADGRNIHKNPS